MDSVYFQKITGEKCYLSPINPDDAARFTKWVNDLEVVQYTSLATVNLNVPNETEALNRLSREHHYTIVEKDRHQPIGSCGFMDLNQWDGTAEIGIFIGDKDFWNAGYGTESMCLLIDYGFQYLNLENILLRVFDFNKRGQACYEKVGFKQIGKRRNALKRFQSSHDIIYMDIIPGDFYKKYQSKLGLK